MFVGLLLIIYIVFISLGLPDSILGSSFPAISDNLGIPSDIGGYFTIIGSAGTIISSLVSNKLIKKIKTQGVVTISIALTIIGILSFSFLTKETFYLAFLLFFITGLGGGGIDSALNNYVAIHYKAIHMNWLHASWGIGATISPLIIGSFINPNNNSVGWQNGVRTIAFIQFGILLLVLLTLPIWNKVKEKNDKREKESNELNVSTTLNNEPKFYKNPIFYLSIIGFFCYCAVETTMCLWTSSFFHYERGFDTSIAASLGSLVYFGIMIGRFFFGIVSLKIIEKTLMRIGSSIALIGLLLTLIPFSSNQEILNYITIAGFFLSGFGFAPIYPAIIKLTPYRFSIKNSQEFIGYQMASAYLGNLTIPVLFGLVAKSLGNMFLLLPFVALFLVILMMILHEIINIKLRIRDSKLTEEERKNYEVIR